MDPATTPYQHIDGATLTVIAGAIAAAAASLAAAIKILFGHFTKVVERNEASANARERELAAVINMERSRLDAATKAWNDEVKAAINANSAALNASQAALTEMRPVFDAAVELLEQHLSKAETRDNLTPPPPAAVEPATKRHRSGEWGRAPAAKAV